MEARWFCVKWWNSESVSLTGIYLFSFRDRHGDTNLSLLAHLLCLGKGTENMRNSVELALSNPSPQFNLVPFPSLQQPLISRPAKIAAIEEMWPKDIDRACSRKKKSANQSPTNDNKTLE